MGASFGKQKFAKSRKISGRFTPLLHHVIHSQQYRQLNHASVRLLFDIAAQFNGSNNGKLVCCMKYLKPLGWTSNDTISKAIKQLKASGLIIQTRYGLKPPCSQAAWFAIGWLALDVHDGLDMNPKDYKQFHAVKYKAGNKKTIPKNGVKESKPKPIVGLATSISIPINGSVKGKNANPSIPTSGDYIYLPSNDGLWSERQY